MLFEEEEIAKRVRDIFINLMYQGA